MRLDAVLWDFDGTLVNSVPKNINITKNILEEVAPRLTGENLPHYLRSEFSYYIANHLAKNWQDLYLNFYGMTEAEMQEAGTLWTRYQLKDKTPVKLFPQIKELINTIDLPQGICSQNSSENIAQVLAENGLSNQVGAIVGYDDIPDDFQKPHPYSGIKCLDSLFPKGDFKNILYVGDHESDMVLAKNIEEHFGDSAKVFSVLVKYSGANPENWNYLPDFEIRHPMELPNVINEFS